MRYFLLFALTAVASYLIGAVNPAILLSNAVYHRDLRQMGSGNAGFTNFRRCFGGKLAWLVFFLDIMKTVIVCLAGGFAFGGILGDFHFGAAFAGLFASVGHDYPVWYGFRGGKGFLVNATAVWFVDWRAGLVAASIFIILLLTVKYMSLAAIIGAASCPVAMLIIGPHSTAVLITCTVSVALMIFRHRKNIVRLFKHTESRFILFGSKSDSGSLSDGDKQQNN